MAGGLLERRCILSIVAGYSNRRLIQRPARVQPADVVGASGVGLTGNSQRPLDGLQVLLAEDGADNVRLIRHHLERAGATVTVVGDGRQAAATVRAAHMGVLERPFDLVLMDVDLPGMDGLSATRDLRASGIDLPVIALTAHGAADDRVRALDAGCNDFASKPIGRTDLLLLVLRWGAAARGRCPGAREPVPATAENA